MIVTYLSKTRDVRACCRQHYGMSLWGEEVFQTTTICKFSNTELREQTMRVCTCRLIKAGVWFTAIRTMRSHQNSLFSQFPQQKHVAVHAITLLSLQNVEIHGKHKAHSQVHPIPISNTSTAHRRNPPIFPRLLLLYHSQQHSSFSFSSSVSSLPVLSPLGRFFRHLHHLSQP